MDRTIQALSWAGNLVGLAVIVYGLSRYFLEGLVPGLLIAVAVIVVGPVEDMLGNAVRRRIDDPATREHWITAVDRATSLAFLLLLLGTIYVAA